MSSAVTVSAVTLLSAPSLSHRCARFRCQSAVHIDVEPLWDSSCVGLIYGNVCACVSRSKDCCCLCCSLSKLCACLPYPDCDLRKPCKNGATCIDKGSGYECSCASGFSGKNCEIGILCSV